MKNGGLASQPGLAAFVLLGFLSAAGCVNRGQHAPDGSAGGDNDTGAGGHTGPIVDAPTDPRGMGGAGGTACIPDAGMVADAMACPALMNFEGCTTYGAVVSDSTVQLGFTGVMTSSLAACGTSALQIQAAFMPPPDGSTATRTGEVSLVIPGGEVDLTGKTISFRAMANPPTNGLTVLYLTPIADTGYGPKSARISPVRNDWTTGTQSYDVPDTPITHVTKFSIQVSSVVAYSGIIYIDEIDITPTPPDGGAGDAGDARSPDVRDGGTTDAAGDTRDAPAG